MNKKELIEKYADSEENKILLAHILDIYDESRRKNIIKISPFLGEKELAAVKEMLLKTETDNCFYYGGYENAERQAVVFLPEYFTAESIINDPAVAGIRYIKAETEKFYGDTGLSHRDYLGALMGIGIKRGCTGDIITSRDGAVIVAADKIAGYIIENLNSVGRYNVRCRFVEKAEIVIGSENIEEIKDTVASMRLDAVISSAFDISRTSASEYIKSGKVFYKRQGMPKARCGG